MLKKCWIVKNKQRTKVSLKIYPIKEASICLILMVEKATCFFYRQKIGKHQQSVNLIDNCQSAATNPILITAFHFSLIALAVITYNL